MGDAVFKKKLMGFMFPFIIIGYMGFVYYSIIYNLYWLQEKEWYSYIILVVFHILLFFILWSYLSAMFVDPGRPPSFWGFYLENPEEKRRRYCLICHTFKPERCHHCSTCGRCVLCMDHHCPWLSNCVGFLNRKYFLLLLFYTWFTLLVGMIAAAYPIYVMATQLIQTKKIDDPYTFMMFILAVGCVVTMLILFVIMTAFISFHLDLIERNSTTIENLEEKKSGPSAVSYDIGGEFNWMQIMGKNKGLWWLPYFGGIGGPNGDGVVFPTKSGNKDDIELQDYYSNNSRSSYAGSVDHNPLVDIADNYNQRNNQTPGKALGTYDQNPAPYHQPGPTTHAHANNPGPANGNGYNPLHTGFGGGHQSQVYGGGYNNTAKPQGPPPGKGGAGGRYGRPSAMVDNRGTYRGTIGNTKVTPLNFNYS